MRALGPRHGRPLAPSRRSGRSGARKPCRPRAGPWLIEGFSRGSELLTLASIAVGVSNTLRAYAPARRRPADPEADSDGVQWGVMSLVSLLPWFSGLVGPACSRWRAQLPLLTSAEAQAWVFAALTDEDRRKTYVAFAAVYSLPLLQRGLSFDPYVLACVLACAVHVQASAGACCLLWHPRVRWLLRAGRAAGADGARDLPAAGPRQAGRPPAAAA